jgi:peptidoglycan hydrolase CwlO-like protein
MKIRLAFLTLTLIAVVAAYFSYSSYIQTKNYENYLIQFDKRLSYTNSRYDNVQEEDHKLNVKIDVLNNKIDALNEKIRIQDALIAEIRTRSKKK